ncbi:hypothetical protein TWF281_010427 [Arthrobotrys megalospora]
MAPTEPSQKQHTKVPGLDSIVGISITIGAIIFLVLMAVVTPKIIRFYIRYRRGTSSEEQRVQVEKQKQREGSRLERSGSSRTGSEVSRAAVENKGQVVEERGRSRIPRALPAVAARPRSELQQLEKCSGGISSVYEEKEVH